jgi:serine/threonine protein phosphatase PrpC
MTEKYKFAKYINSSTKIRKGIEVRTYSAASSLADNSPIYIAIMAEEHDADWSGQEPHSGDNTEIVSLITGAFDKLKPLLISDRQILEDTILSSSILAAYKKAETLAEASKINTSLLILLLQGRKLYIGSIGVCKCFLIRNKKISQINVDDYLRIEADGKFFVATSSLLTNTIGAGKVESLADIHLKRYEIEPQDILLLCSEAFHQNISEDEIIHATSLNEDVDELCRSLAEKAIPRLRTLDSLALCLIRVQQGV